MKVNHQAIEDTIDFLETLDDEQCDMRWFYDDRRGTACIAGWALLNAGLLLGSKEGVTIERKLGWLFGLSETEVLAVCYVSHWPREFQLSRELQEFSDRDLMMDRLEHLLRTGE